MKSHLSSRWHHHLSLWGILAGAAILLLGGAAGAVISAQHYRDTYRAPLPVPMQRHRITARTGPLPHRASIHLQYFAAQINDQGPIGSCQAWAFAKELSYAFNWMAPHHFRFYSPRFAYDAISSGSDAGSYLEQYPPVATDAGIPRWHDMPYGQEAPARGLPSYAVDYPIPGSFSALAAAHRFHITEQQLWGFSQGAGPGGLALIKQEIASFHAVNVDFPVFPEYDQANADGSTVTLPSPGEVDRGGHANVAVAYDDSHPNGDGSVGAVLASNQWSWDAGVGADGIRHPGGRNGFVWLSYAFVEQHVFDAAVIHVPAQTGLPTAHGKPLPADGGNSRLFPAPPGTPNRVKTATSWYVHGVTLTTGQDASPLLNAAGDRYHVWPIGLAATLGVESSLNPYSERWAGGLDNSCGLAQQIITNVTYYTGITDPRAACSWEEVPANSISLEARMYRDFFDYQHGCVPWPQAYEMYNAGPGYACSWYSYPSADVAAHQQVFLGWYSYALAHWQGSPPPPPRPFNYRLYCRYSWSHRKSCPSPTLPGRPYRLNIRGSIFYSHPRVGSIESPGSWTSRRHGFMTYIYTAAVARYWPDFRAIRISTKLPSPGTGRGAGGEG